MVGSDGENPEEKEESTYSYSSPNPLGEPEVVIVPVQGVQPPIPQQTLDELISEKEYNKRKKKYLSGKSTIYNDMLSYIHTSLKESDQKTLKTYVGLGLPSALYEEIKATSTHVSEGIQFIVDAGIHGQGLKGLALGGGAAGALAMVVGTFLTGGLLPIVAVPLGVIAVPAARELKLATRLWLCGDSYEHLAKNVERLGEISTMAQLYAQEQIEPKISQIGDPKKNEKMRSKCDKASLTLTKYQEIVGQYAYLIQIREQINNPSDQAIRSTKL